ncbi:hypothetical protein [Burkholderia sp. Bp9004]|uniref:hypothetical protein n=1 Tax=Burkholderia sp. Bp9004 TaxID=2184559 RepID=UPI00163AFC92|nr:hypothetical protein [Burkholderia sp. Bp9004]
MISAKLLALAVFTAHTTVMGAFRTPPPVETAWIGIGVFILLYLARPARHPLGS